MDANVDHATKNVHASATAKATDGTLQRSITRFSWHNTRATDETSDRRNLPTPPRPFGEPEPTVPAVGALSQHWSSPLFRRRPTFCNADSMVRRTWIEDGSINLTFEVGTPATA